MELLTVGLDFNCAPISMREKLALSPDSIISTSQKIARDIEIPELVVLSTCNRVEYYLRGENRGRIFDWLSKKHQLDYHQLKQNSYTHDNREGVEHLMSLACGLKSMVVGEVQILGQIKQSFDTASKLGLVEKFLSKLFQQSFSTAKKVRGNTDISVNPISIAYAAVKLAGNIFSNLSNATALIVGAGDTARLILTHLIGSGVKNIIIANRTLERTEVLIDKAEISSDINIIQIPLNEIPEKLYLADIVISSTASQLPIIGKGTVEVALKARKRKPIYMVDVAMPRDIEPQVSELDDVYLYCLDDLQKIVSKNKILRLSEAEKAKCIIKSEADNFSSWWNAQKYVTTVCKLRDNFNNDKQQILTSGLKDLKLGKDPYDVLDKIANQLTNRLLHKPTIGMKKAALNEDKALLRHLENIFNL